MSATTSFSNPEPPRLLFGSPPFSPRSPLHTQTPASPPPIAMEEPEDVDMTTSTTLPAQNHDRQDDAMEDGGEAAPQVVGEGDHTSSGNNQASREEELSGDAMDTTPDPSPQPEPLSEPQPPQPHSQSAHTSQENAPSAPAATADASGYSSSQVSPPDAAALSNADGTQIEVEESQPPSDPASTTMPPPQHSNQHDDSSSESSDDDIIQWHEVIEDTSVPEEDELKEIEASTERSATDGKFSAAILSKVSLTMCRYLLEEARLCGSFRS